MGANYDIVISPCRDINDVMSYVRKFVSRAHSLGQIQDLQKSNILDDRAILLGKPFNGWIQILASARGLGYSLVEWFHDNPLASCLSNSCGQCLHVWSLDSGGVAGYAFFEQGRKVESLALFANAAKNMAELMPGVPAPVTLYGDRLGNVIEQKDYDFSADMAIRANLEIGIATVIAKFGFQVHLLDFYDATDEKEGAFVEGDKYVAVPLSGWKAVLFQ